MTMINSWTRARKGGVIALAVASGLAVVASPLLAQSKQKEIVITVKSIKAIDKLDAFSKADFFARVRIAGQTIDSPIAKQAEQATPNWEIKKTVPAGRHSVQLEIFDKDLTKVEAIDINRIDKKRDLDFTVDTRTCRIAGFANGYRCGDTITRAGNERKKAEISFTVDVR